MSHVQNYFRVDTLIQVRAKDALVQTAINENPKDIALGNILIDKIYSDNFNMKNFLQTSTLFEDIHTSFGADIKAQDEYKLAFEVLNDTLAQRYDDVEGPHSSVMRASNVWPR